MNLSELVYQCVKNVKYLEDDGFTRETFLNGDYDNDTDYANSINNVFTPLNEAVQRLSDLNKIRFVVRESTLGDNGEVSLASFFEENEENDIGVIKNVAIYENNNYHTLDYRLINEKLKVISNVKKGTQIYIEYAREIKTFTRSDVSYSVEEGEQKDIDLSNQYGITNNMCQYIIEYVKGKLSMIIDPSIAITNVNTAESYFNNLPTYYSQLFQKSVSNTSNWRW